MADLVDKVAEELEGAGLEEGAASTNSEEVPAEAAAEESSEVPQPSDEDKEICSKPSIDRGVKIDELVRLLNVF